MGRFLASNPVSQLRLKRLQPERSVQSLGKSYSLEVGLSPIEANLTAFIHEYDYACERQFLAATLSLSHPVLCLCCGY